MTATLLLIWTISGSDVSLGQPWSAWFIALLICAIFDMVELT